MARPLRIEYPDAFYHVIQRGIEKKSIFISDNDKERFLLYLASAHTTYNAIIHTYILMNNHYHLILETPRANLSKIMHYLNTSYAVYYNTKRKRVGPLYQGRFKAILIQQDEYLHHLSRYIHLNPVRTDMVKSPEEHNWSSYKYFISENKPPQWLKISFILSMFDKNTLRAKKLYKQFVLDDIGGEKNIIKENMKKGFILGDEDFFESIKNKLINKEADPEIPILKELKHKKEPTMNYIKQTVEKNVKDN
ncbi:MAG: transposase, partial [Candidatus Omnitrophota bacterium]|nr:transposase [Candidatus Omnitrophota bacterium]